MPKSRALSRSTVAATANSAVAHLYFHWVQPWLFIAATVYVLWWSQPRTTTRFAALVLAAAQLVSNGVSLVNVAVDIPSWLTSDIASATSVLAGTAIALKWRINGEKPWWMLALVGLYMLQIMGRASREDPWVVAAYLNTLNALQLLLVRYWRTLERVTTPVRLRMRHPAGRRTRSFARGIAQADYLICRLGGAPKEVNRR